jgi:hypothetical protein
MPTTWQDRPSSSASTVIPVNWSGGLPAYVRIGWSGNTYTAYTSTDGVNWTAVAGSSVSLNLGSSVLAGIAVTSHNDGTLTTATLDTVSISSTASAAHGPDRVLWSPEGGVSLRWTQSTTPGVTQNKIYRRTNTGSYSSTPTATISTSTPYVDRKLTSGARYCYEVTR